VELGEWGLVVCFPVYLSLTFLSSVLACFLFLGYHLKSQLVQQEDLHGGLVRRYAPLSKYHAGVTTWLGPCDGDKRQDGQRCNILSYKSSGWQACALVFASRVGLQNRDSFITESVEVFATDSRRINSTSQFALFPL
jgi:hypothetical protein